MLHAFLIVLGLVDSVVSGAYTFVVINQTNAVIDANPIINFSEIQFFKSGVQVQVYSEDMWFSATSSGFPAYLCNDGITQTGSGPYNMCKSANDNPSGQWFAVFVSEDVDQMKLYNAFGFNNPSGFDVGKRIEGATLTVSNLVTSAVLLSSTFSAPFQALYTISIPTPAPTLQPVLAPNTPTFKPTATAKPTATPKPSSKAPLLARSNNIPTAQIARSGSTDDLAQ